MILLLGSSGYIAEAFIRELDSLGIAFRPISRREVDYTNFRELLTLLRSARPDAVINCSAFIAGGTADECEQFKRHTIASNLVFPALLAQACSIVGTKLIHVSTGCLFNGNNRGKGYSETDLPQLSFRTTCGVYVGSKELAEQFVSQYPEHYICRIRLPFDQYDHRRNYLSKLMYYEKAVRATNSISHRGDFVKAVLDLYCMGAPYGTYNVMNPGAVDSEWICRQINRHLRLEKKFVFWDPEEFLHKVARTPKSNCVLSVGKLLRTGVRIRPVSDAIVHSLKNWVAAPKA